MINVTKSFMPPIEEYEQYIEKIWKNNWLTNEGPLLKELTGKMEDYLQLNHINMVSNGTLALQLAINALNIDSGEIITTPFSFVATTSSIIWENCKPVFVDIDKDTLCIDVNKIEQAITKQTKAILAVHVFGYPCDVDEIEKIARKHNLKVIYDGAHAFGSIYKGKSLLGYGDITTCSFHSTKLFHTIEGGACISKEKNTHDIIQQIKTFGNINGNYDVVGINCKMTEFSAAMGLANFKYISKIIEERRKISELYDELLKEVVIRPKFSEDLQYNYSYYPVILKSEKILLDVVKKLNQKEIFPRRYFYPSLNKLKYIQNKKNCPISEDISKRILCLPLYVGLEKEKIIEISNIILDKEKNK